MARDEGGFLIVKRLGFIHNTEKIGGWVSIMTILI